MMNTSAVTTISNVLVYSEVSNTNMSGQGNYSSAGQRQNKIPQDIDKIMEAKAQKTQGRARLTVIKITKKNFGLC